MELASAMRSTSNNLQTSSVFARPTALTALARPGFALLSAPSR
jgi:hypothetical protein